ncbi:protein-L-isoaspartate O-methyltransferase [Sulfolobus sp. A20]|uniref:protein-L-isoaspartate O-methyltransferase family protein n=1 Tax=Saccharolobus sp. A20 TaxID=1891280 RepID=UPI000845F24D|nr:protein-L-isoaspartate O-methyltransferase [Sulfolobus sp. A20]AOL16882.1 protein-L-isoaspartate O-methyltransferase [Sulfolobus sp. A20]TRM78725.1 protein-L-isoaspartate O-methyltransferase [Sulfolobus sp. A20-N-F8]TRM82642.1 protein-L-isoaspartate O-methyltransferase [Sulfolobus sp. F3]TRM95534.1 protein-L-isoaspartate O-methyltransferase [Sulfolobus sp. A20-N-G8]
MSARNNILSSIRNPRLAKAFMKVNREDFLPDVLKKFAYDPAYVNDAFHITPNITTTALSLGILMLDVLDLREEHKVLEVGTGIGYYTALIAEIVGDKNVVSIEIDDYMYDYAKRLLSPRYPNMILIKGDGSLGYEKLSPYDRAVIWAASPTIPSKIYDQLKDKGIMVLPIGCGKVQGLYKIVKDGYEPKLQRLGDVVFMKMRGVFGFYEDDNNQGLERRLRNLEEKVSKILSKLKIDTDST